MFNKMIRRISSILGEMRDIETGTASSNDTQMLLDYEDKRFIVTFTEIDNPNEDMFKDIEWYLRRTK
jgi:hypothetical protein